MSHFTHYIPLSFFPFKFLRRTAKVNPLIVNYHVVSDRQLSHIKHLYRYRDSKTFTEDLGFLKKKYYPIGLREFLDSIKNNTKLPDNSVLLTFDDGFKEIYEIVAPIMADNKMTATIFLTKNFVDNKELGYDNKKSLLIERLSNTINETEKAKIIKILASHDLLKGQLTESVLDIPYMHRQRIDDISQVLNLNYSEFLKTNSPYLTSIQIKELIHQGFTIGGHSIDHPRFSELSIDDQIVQAKTSIDFVCNKYSLNYRVFAFPYNDFFVSRHFFDAISGNMDATFGTNGLMRDSAINNYQRISVEKFNRTAKETIKFHYFRKTVYSVLKKDIIVRDNNK